MTSDTLLAAAAARADITENADCPAAGPQPVRLLGQRADVLNALLGDGAATALQTANWDEWSDFVETLSAWLAEPKAATVTLNGADYTLPEARPDSLDGHRRLCPAAGPRRPATRRHCWPPTAPTRPTPLTGPLNGVYSAVTLEWDHHGRHDGREADRSAAPS